MANRNRVEALKQYRTRSPLLVVCDYQAACSTTGPLAALSGAQVVDGVSVGVLSSAPIFTLLQHIVNVRHQTDRTLNGNYIAYSDIAWGRLSTANYKNAVTFIAGGTQNKHKAFRLTAAVSLSTDERIFADMEWDEERPVFGFFPPQAVAVSSTNVTGFTSNYGYFRRWDRHYMDFVMRFGITYAAQAAYTMDFLPPPFFTRRITDAIHVMGVGKSHVLAANAENIQGEATNGRMRYGWTKITNNTTHTNTMMGHITAAGEYPDLEDQLLLRP